MDYKVLKEASELLTFYIDALEAAKHNLWQAAMFDSINHQRSARVKHSMRAAAERHLAEANMLTAKRVAQKIAIVLASSDSADAVGLIYRAYSLSSELSYL